MNTKTPNRKSSAVIISTAKMTWVIGRELIDSIDKIVTSDQIKKCNIELENQRIKLELNSVEAAAKVIENMNNKVVQEQKVTAYQDIS